MHGVIFPSVSTEHVTSAQFRVIQRWKDEMVWLESNQSVELCFFWSLHLLQPDECGLGLLCRFCTLLSRVIKEPDHVSYTYFVLFVWSPPRMQWASAWPFRAGASVLTTRCSRASSLKCQSVWELHHTDERWAEPLPFSSWDLSQTRNIQKKKNILVVVFANSVKSFKQVLKLRSISYSMIIFRYSP